MERQLTAADLQKRVDRLADLARGFQLELSRMAKGNDPLLNMERQAYLTALRKAVEGCEEARVGLAAARQRVENGTRAADGPDRLTCNSAAQLPAAAVFRATLLKVLLALLPRAVTAEMQTTRMRASMTAYSTAVGPLSSFRKRAAVWYRRLR
jgi:hypothetical protein